MYSWDDMLLLCDGYGMLWVLCDAMQWGVPHPIVTPHPILTPSTHSSLPFSPDRFLHFGQEHGQPFLGLEEPVLASPHSLPVNLAWGNNQMKYVMQS